MLRNLLFILIISGTLHGQDSYNFDYLFLNVNVITMKEDMVIKRRNILVKDGFIKEISDISPDLIKAKYKVNLKGKFIMPSMSDAHVHLPKREEDLKKFFILNLINGVTKLRSMRGSWEHLKWREKYNGEKSYYPKLYLSPPPISRLYDFNNELLVRYIKASKPFDFIKILSIKNEFQFKRLDSLCKSKGVYLGGHFPKNVSDSVLFNSQYTSFEHLGGLTNVPKELLEKRLKYISMNKLFICPTLSWYDIGSGRYSYEELRNQPGMEYISKNTIDEWIEKTKEHRNALGKQTYDKEVSYEIKKLKQKFHTIKMLNESGVKMLLSPDSSSKYMIPGFGILGEMKLIKNSGLTNFEILKMSTVNFADFFGEDYGVIEKGEKADFIILKENPIDDLDTLSSIEGLFFNNHYLDRKDLKRLSNSILPD